MLMSKVFRVYEGRDVACLVDLMAQLGYAHTIDSLDVNIKALRRVGGEVFVA